MDIGLLVLAFADLVYGVLGLCGIQNVPPKYRGKSWTKSYMHSIALAEILTAVLLAAMVLLTRNRELSIPVAMLLIAVCVAPSLIWAYALSRKYNKKLKDGIE